MKVLSVVLMFVGAAAAAAIADEIDPHDMRFKILKVGDWPSTLPMEPLIEFHIEQGRQVYRVTAPSSCGLSVRKPGYNLVENSLILSYEEYVEDPVATEVCAFKSEFSFKGLPSQKLNAKLLTTMAAE